MKINVFAALLLATTLAAGTAVAQPAPFNEIGVTMGHWHIISKDVEANKKLFTGMGGKLFMPGGQPLMMFPGVYINLTLGTEKGEGGSQGSVVNHVGFIVNNVQERVAQWKAAGVPVLPGNNNRLDQAFVETPDGVRIEILEDKSQSMPIRHEHVHLFLPEAEISKAVAWYEKTFGGKAGTRNKWRFRAARCGLRAPTRSRSPPRAVLDHRLRRERSPGLHQKIEAEGIKFDGPIRKAPSGSTITYITDSWGTATDHRTAPVTSRLPQTGRARRHLAKPHINGYLCGRHHARISHVHVLLDRAGAVRKGEP